MRLVPAIFASWFLFSLSAGSAQKAVLGGIEVRLEIEPVDSPARAAGELQEGDQVRVRFRIADAGSGTPLSGSYPAAWMDLEPKATATDREKCQEKVESFVGGSLLAQPELDLNVYHVLAMNQDATISVVDPLFGYGTTKLLNMIFLRSPGEDWILAPDQSTLYVSLPDSHQVAVASTSTWKVTANLDTGPRPSRLALQPDGRYLWVGFDAPRTADGPSGVTVLDTQGPRVIKEIATGRGHHEIAVSDDNRYAFVTNQDDGTLSVLDVAKLEKVRDVPVGKEPVSVAYSPLSKAAYVVSRGDGTVVAIDAASHQVVARMPAEPGLGQIAFAPGGRLGFVVSTEKNVVHILDTAVNRIVQTAEVEKGPDQVAFSDELAYIRHRDSELVLMIPLNQVGSEGRPVPVIDFPGGQRPFGGAKRPSPAASVVQAPGAAAVLVANPGDQAIYYYKEGMAAPMGQFQNYGRQPRAVLAVDRSLKERTPGSYETVTTLRSPGHYDVAFFLDAPRTIHCFAVDVAEDPQLAAARARQRSLHVEPVVERRLLAVGEKVALRFKLTDATSGAPARGLEDVSVLTFLSSGRDKQSQLAREAGDGVYEIELQPEHSGLYYVFVECPSKGLELARSPFVTLQVKARGAGT